MRSHTLCCGILRPSPAALCEAGAEGRRCSMLAGPTKALRITKPVKCLRDPSLAQKRYPFLANFRRLRAAATTEFLDLTLPPRDSKILSRLTLQRCVYVCTFLLEKQNGHRAIQLCNFRVLLTYIINIFSFFLV